MVLTGRAGTPATTVFGGAAPRDAGPGRYPRTPADADAVRDDGARTDPHVVLDHDPLRRNALLDERPPRLVEDMIDGHDLAEGRRVYPVADLDAPLAADHRVLANQAVATDADARVRKVAEVVYVQHGAVHDDRAGADLDPRRARMQVDALVEVGAGAKPGAG